MTHPTEPPADMVVQPSKGRARSRISIVWLVPLIALAGALYFAFGAIKDQDVSVQIDFQEANGIVAGKTLVKFREVEVGHVETVEFSDDLNKVEVHAKIRRDMADFLDADAEFWVVSAEVSAQGISGLETVLSGSYIAASWNAEKGAPKREFTALQDTPPSRADSKGTLLTLRAQETGSVSVGAPVLLRGISVGRVEHVALSDSGDAVLFKTYVDSPYDEFITTGTRFWNSSGIDVSLGAGGVNLNVESLSSLIQGGIVFDTLFSGGSSVSNGSIFDLYKGEDEARNSLFDDSLESLVYLSSEFDGNLRGLKVGADVSYKGLKVGEVTEMSARVVTSETGEDEVKLVANLAVQPNRLGLNPNQENEQTLAFLNELVKRGLRAQLSSSGLLASTLFVDLVQDEDAASAQIDLFATPYPSFPSIPAEPDTLASAAEGVLTRVSGLPIEELLNEAIETLVGIQKITSDEKIQEIPGSVVGILQSVESFVASDSLQKVPDELSGAISDVRKILSSLEESSAIANLTAVLQSANDAAEDVSIASKKLPSLVGNIDDLVAKLADLPIQEMATSANELIISIDGFVQSEGVQSLPGALTETLSELKTVLQEVQDGGAVDNLNAVLASANEAVKNIGTASEGLPQLVEDIDALVKKAGSLPLEELATSADALLQSADAILATEGMQALPESLSAALDQVRSVLGELQDGGAVENLNNTLASAENAANEVALAAQSLPDLVKRLDRLANQAEATLAAYDGNSPINREATLAVRAFRKAAEDASSLAKTIERKPNSLLVGR
ncbi:MAG: MlaD family protein [Pseudoruegeria sp.]